MHRLVIILTAILCVVFGLNTLYAASIDLVENGNPAVLELTGSSRNISGELSIGQIDISEGVVINGESYSNVIIDISHDKLFSGFTSVPGEARLPVLTCYFAVPPDGDIDVTINSVKTKTLENVIVAPEHFSYFKDGVEIIENKISESYYTTDTFLPHKRYEIQNGGTLRNFNIRAVNFYPVSYNPSSGMLEVATNVSFEIDISGGDFLIPEQRGTRKVSEAFLPFYEMYICNPEVLDNLESSRGKYWIITHDMFYIDLMLSDLPEWKNRKGYEVIVTQLSEIGSNPNYYAIRNYIRGQYHSWDVKPDYILLVGDMQMPGNQGLDSYLYVHNDPDPYLSGQGVSDNYYTFMDDDDYFPDILIGRFPVNNVTELNYVIYKTLSYDKDTYLDNTDWYLRGVVAAGEDPWYYNFISSRWTVLLSRDMMLASGFTQVDTQFASGYQPAYPGVVIDAINQGVSYINYRGWGDTDGWTTPRFERSSINLCNNGRMFAFMTATVCAVGDFEVDECLGEDWLTKGTINEPKGGVAFTGNANHYGHTRWTNAINAGLYEGLFVKGLTTPTQALLAGKFNIYYGFPGDTHRNGQVEFYFNSYNILGDPELNLFTTVPHIFDIDQPASIAVGTNFLHLDISEGGSPVEGALVCALKSGEVFERIYSDANGNADIPFANLTAGTLKITVTKRNFAPEYFDLDVVDQSMIVGYLSHTIDDDNNGSSQGNGDGIINPGETVELDITLKNYGNSLSAVDVSLDAVAMSEYITVESGQVDYGIIDPGQNASGSTPVVVSIDADCPHDNRLLLRLDISERTDSFQASLNDIVRSYYIVIRDLIIDDSPGNNDGILDPGESADIYLDIVNDGTVDAYGLSATLESQNENIIILQGYISIGDLPAGGSINQTDEAFSVSATTDIYPGTLSNLPLRFSSSDNVEQQSSIGMTIGTVNSYDPIGPDDYGYYCFDNTDAGYTERPVYDWIEIADSWNYFDIWDDNVAEVNLPFTFRYYGQDYDIITICDNGYIAFGSTWWPNFFNGQIPGPQNAPAQLSGMWNDFKGVNLRTRVYYNSPSPGIFVIGWKNAMLSGNYQRQTFEIILYDPDTYPTVTGDGVIVYQYQTLRYFTSCTVGITSPDKTDGIQYYFEGIDIPGSAGLTDGCAVKFTTNTGMTPVDINHELPLTTSLNCNYPNPFNNSTIISFNLAEKSNVNIEIFNLLGQKAAALIDEEKEAGTHSVTWDASSQTSGVYFIKLTTNNYSNVKKAVLIK